MDFPVVSNHQQIYPEDGVCPICGQSKVHEPHSFAVLLGGACLMNRAEDIGGPADEMDGLLELVWHGAHDDGVGEHAGSDGVVQIARNVRGGQFQILFCSTGCLRKFLSRCVDQLERAIGDAPASLPS